MHRDSEDERRGREPGSGEWGSGVPPELIPAVERFASALAREVCGLGLRVASRGRGTSAVQVVRRDTGEVLRWLSPSEFLEMARRLDRLGDLLAHAFDRS